MGVGRCGCELVWCGWVGVDGGLSGLVCGGRYNQLIVSYGVVRKKLVLPVQREILIQVFFQNHRQSSYTIR